MIRPLPTAVALLALTAPDAAAQSLAKGFDPTTDWPRFPKLFEPSNTSPDRKARYTPDGVAFEIGPAPAAGNVMFIGETRLAGNFQVEVKYQIDALPEKVVDGSGRYGAMFGLRVVIDDKEGDAAMNRGVYPQDGQSYRAGRMVPLGQKRHYAGYGQPTTSRHGRMGLRRAGDRVLCLASDTPDGPFMAVTEYPFPAGRAVSRVVLYADSGGQPALVKGRLYDLRLVTGADVPTAAPPRGPKGRELTPLPTPQAVAAAKAAAPPPAYPDRSAAAVTADSAAPESPQPPAVRGNWWLPVVTLLVGLVGGVLIGRRWRPATPAPAPPEPPPTTRLPVVRPAGQRPPAGPGSAPKA